MSNEEILRFTVLVCVLLGVLFLGLERLWFAVGLWVLAGLAAVPIADEDADRVVEEATDGRNALDTLGRRYARGALSADEFDRRYERLAEPVDDRRTGDDGGD